ncbi:DNA-directed RNA polymerase III subunit 1 isoform X2 [Rhodamnia argentea]|uniref:DNA-directed RNA polymerase subunit n=1 Tax=Rhodamnia argentea TaxID=178133 RepID=A0ABM3HSC8_9MYRT|nr:DNA-directed RNA polymerase III subunit 1 isoform X2 [Rhodamnia argentea]
MKAASHVFTKEPYVEDVGPRRIKSIRFSTFSASEVGKIAEVQVYRGVYYDQKRMPLEGGLLDPRMGPANKSFRCNTCYGDFKDCPGHFGYLTLALPVYNVGFLAKILEILKSICKSCSRILLEEESRRSELEKIRHPKRDALNKAELAKKIVNKCKPGKCARCGYINGTVKKAVGAISYIHDRSKTSDRSLEECKSAISHAKESKGFLSVASNILNPRDVLSLFERMSDEDCELLNVADRPEKFMITTIAVPPIAIRPSVMMEESRSNENDITERLKRIIQVNASLQQELQEIKNLAAWDHLQAEVGLYINSDVRGVPYPFQAAKPLAGFIQRLKGKQGRFRGNLSGKRVEYTGRTVISPDPNLKITEVAIPIQMARILTYPERVNQYNIEKLRQCVRNGPYKYPGARMIRYPDGEMRLLMANFRKRLADELGFGAIVERHLEDGDVVLFNRQPSLHRMSIMCHRARVMPWKTLRFNESVCNPYNADFDGDEMNLHVPQTEEARAEALMLMGVQNNLCTPKNGEILVASTQDFLTSSFLITRKDIFYDRAAFSLICSYLGDSMDLIDLPTPAIIKPIELWTGKQIFSVLLRPNARMRVFVNLTVKEKNYSKPKSASERELETMCPNDGFVYFRNSELISGQLGKATLGNGNKDGLYSVLLRDYNAHAAAACMNRLAKLSARWIGNHGFSIGIDDVQPDNDLNERKRETILNGYSSCDEKIELYNKGKLQLQPGCDAAQTLEAVITDILNQIRNETGQVCMKKLHWRNSPLIMSQCGSKGSPINISQMIACVGQQSVGGRRAPNGFIDRSLPHFPRKSKTPAAKGFVANSFYSGLTATEFFFHTMGGREGLVDTAVKTAETGYMSRRLMKALEDLSIHYDNTVRNASGCIVQFLYGDDCMDPAQMEGKSGFPLNFNRLLMKVKATCRSGEHKYLSAAEITSLIEQKLPENESTSDGGLSDASKAFKKSLKAFLLEEHEKGSKIIFDFGEDATGESCETVNRVAQKIGGITEEQLRAFIDTCISRYHFKRIEAGSAIGAIGAHSIGEPGTQMTLKTFHFAGVASMNVTLGVPRIKEIINGTKKILTPIITAELDRDDNVNIARMVKARIDKTILGQIAKSIKIVMTSRLGSIVITLDMNRIEESQLSIDANTVRESIMQTTKIKPKQLQINVLDVTKLEVVPLVDRGKLHFELHSLKNMLPNVIVKGVKTVERAVVNKGKEKYKDNEGKAKEREKYSLVVEGTGLQEVMGTDGIDGRKSKSNHVIEGEVLGITRFGIQKMDKSVLMLASFEKTSDHLFNASASGKADKIEGVSECIIMGVPMQLGTGILKVIQRDEKPELTYASDPIISSC